MTTTVSAGSNVEYNPFVSNPSGEVTSAVDVVEDLDLGEDTDWSHVASFVLTGCSLTYSSGSIDISEGRAFLQRQGANLSVRPKSVSASLDAGVNYIYLIGSPPDTVEYRVGANSVPPDDPYVLVGVVDDDTGDVVERGRSPIDTVVRRDDRLAPPQGSFTSGPLSSPLVVQARDDPSLDPHTVLAHPLALEAGEGLDADHTDGVAELTLADTADRKEGWTVKGFESESVSGSAGTRTWKTYLNSGEGLRLRILGVHPDDNISRSGVVMRCVEETDSGDEERARTTNKRLTGDPIAEVIEGATTVRFEIQNDSGSTLDLSGQAGYEVVEVAPQSSVSAGVWTASTQDTPRAVVYDPVRNYVVAGDASGTLYQIDVETGTIDAQAAVAPNSEPTNDLAYSPAGDAYLTAHGTANDSVGLFKVDPGSLSVTELATGLNQPWEYLAVTGNGEFAAVGLSSGGVTMYGYDLAGTQQWNTTVISGTEVQGFEFIDNLGGFLWSNGDNGTSDSFDVLLIDPADGSTIWQDGRSELFEFADVNGRGFGWGETQVREWLADGSSSQVRTVSEIRAIAGVDAVEEFVTVSGTSLERYSATGVLQESRTMDASAVSRFRSRPLTTIEEDVLAVPVCHDTNEVEQFTFDIF